MILRRSASVRSQVRRVDRVTVLEAVGFELFDGSAAELTLRRPESVAELEPADQALERETVPKFAGGVSARLAAPSEDRG